MRSFSFTPIALASLLMLQTVQVHAQKSDEEELGAIYGDKSTVSIATGNAQPLRRAPAVATVITAEDIAAMGAHDLDDVLETVPGMHVSREGQFYAPKYVLRGLGVGGPTNPQILFLQNGIPRSSLYSGDHGVPFVGYGVQNIARIEIIRGPGSALYGADAFAGVVNIITKTSADTPGTEVGMYLGSQKTKNLWYQYGGKIGKVDTAVYINAARTDGVAEVIQADAASRNDTLFHTKSSFAPGPVNNHHDDIDVGVDLAYENFKVNVLYHGRGDVGTGAGVNSALDNSFTRYSSERFASTLSWADKNFGKDLAIGTSLSYQTSKERPPTGILLFPPGTVLPKGLFADGMIGGPGRWERQLRLSAYANYSGFKSHQIRLGLGHDDLDLYKSETFKNFMVNEAGAPVPIGNVTDFSVNQPHILPQRRKVNYLYVQDEWDFAKDWALTAGVRHDRYSDFGRTTNPRFALVWDSTPNLTTKLLYGRAFRAPSFNESYGINPVANGNKDLAPETINTTELAASWQASNSLQLNMNVYRFERKNIIVAVTNATPGTGSTYSNTGNQSGKGIELEMSWDFSRSLHLTGNYSYQKTRDDKQNHDVGYAPHHHLYGRVDWRFANGWQLDTQLNWVANRERSAGDARLAVSDYKTLDLTLRSTRALAQWDFSASVKNLFNADVREPSLAPGLALPNDLPMARRTLYFQAIYKM